MTSSGSPPKPWEINRSASVGNLRSSAESNDTKTPPPVPARPSQQRSSLYQPSYGGLGSPGYSGYGSGYGGHGGYGMYGSSMYGSSGMYGSTYRPYGSTPMPGTFTQHAEDSTRQAFQSVESIVRAFTSVSTMLESTLGAVYSSFRAVLDVADHLSRVKTTFSDILSSIAIFRFLRFLYRRAMSLLRLQPYDEAWEGSSSEKAISVGSSQSQKKSWPILLFVAVVLGGPYLIWKLLRGLNSQKPSAQSWVSGEGDHVLARVEYDFQGEGDEEVSLQAGETIVLAPRELQPKVRGWLIGTKDGKTTGYLPANYVKILGLRRGRNQQAATATPPQPNKEPAPRKTFTKASSPPAPKHQTITEEEWESIHSESTRTPGSS